MTTATAEAPATAKSESPSKPKGPAPVLRAIEKTETGWKDTLVLWPTTSEGSTAMLKGFIVDGGKQVRVLGYLGENKEKGTKFIALKNPEARDAHNHMAEVATGNAVNQHKDSSTVYFDTIVFNVGKGDSAKPVFARLTNAASAEFQQKLGFTSARVPRPAKDEASRAADEAAPESEVPEEPEVPAAKPSARPRFGG